MAMPTVAVLVMVPMAMIVFRIVMLVRAMSLRLLHRDAMPVIALMGMVVIGVVSVWHAIYFRS